MKLNKGLYQDTRFNDQPEGSWRTAKNIVPEGPNIIKNESGFEKNPSIPQGLYLHGEIPLPDNKVIVFLINRTSNADDSIGVIDDKGNYTLLIENTIDKLSFDKDYPISGDYIFNSKGELIIVFTDNKNAPRLVNLGFLNSKVTFDNDNKIKLFPNTQVPDVILSGVHNGGSLETGIYYLFFAYESEDTSQTNWMSPTNPISIVSSSVYDNFFSITGDKEGSAGGKTISLQLNNIDISFTKLKMAVIKKIGGIVSAEDVTSFTITDSQMEVSYSGDEITSDLLVEELVSNTATYEKVGSLKINNNTLYLGNTFEENVLDYQKYANNIVVKWYAGNQVSMDSGRGSYKDPYTIYTKRTFNPGEVAALYIAFDLKDGGISPAFHIPGRPANLISEDGVNWTSTGAVSDREALTDPTFTEINLRAKRFHFYETGVHTPGTSEGHMGYWENLDEKYPGEGPDSQYDSTDLGGRNLHTEDGGKIKHHRFPSVTKLIEWGFPLYTDVGTPDSSGDQEITGTYTITTSSALNTNITKGAGYPYQRVFFSYNQTDQLTDTTMKVGGSVGLQLSSETYLWNGKYNFVIYKGDIDTGYNDFNAFISSDEAFQALPTGQSWTSPGNNTYFIFDKFSLSITDNKTIHTIDNTTYTNMVFNKGEGVALHAVQPSLSVQPTGTDPYVSGNVTYTFSGKGIETGNVTGKAFGHPLGIKLINVVIPPEIREKVQGYRIYYAERSVSNSLSLGMSVSFDGINSISGGEIPKNTDANPYVRLYPPDMMTFKPNNKPTHLQILGVIPLNYGKEFSDADGGTDFPLKITGPYIGNPTLDAPAELAADSTKHLIRKVKNTQYIQRDNAAGVIDNSFREGFYYAEIDHSIEIPANVIIDIGSANAKNRYLVSLMTFKSNLYNSLYEQNLVSTGSFFPVTGDSYIKDTPPIYGGDSFLSIQYQTMSCPTYEVLDLYGIPRNYTSSYTAGRIVWYAWPVFSSMNVGFVYEGEEWFEKSYPMTWETKGTLMPNGFTTPSYVDKPHVEGSAKSSGTYSLKDKVCHIMTLEQPRFYNADYTSINNIDQSVVPFDPSLTYINENNALMARSLRGQSANPIANIRRFLSGDIFEMPKDKGAITNLAILGDTLFIHMEHGLFRTVGKEIFNPANSVEVVIGSGDIFQRDPKQMLFSGAGGYAGTTSKYAAVSSPLGYFFIDERQGKVFLVTDSVKELSAMGLRKFFRDYGTFTPGQQSNPYHGTGFTASYDRKFNRLLLTKQNGNDSWTLSYSGDHQSWYSFHDYHPVSLFNSDSCFAADAAGNIYTMNSNASFGLYFETEPYPSYVDAVFKTSPGAGMAGVLSAINWQTDVVDPKGQYLRQATIDKVMVYNNYQNSGEIEIVPMENTRNVHTAWKFNKFRDLALRENMAVKEPFYELDYSKLDLSRVWHKKKRFMDHFAVVRLIFENKVLQDGQNTLYLYNVDPELLPLIR